MRALQSMDQSSPALINCLEGYHTRPLLSEPVEACGDGFDCLREPYGNPENNDFDVFWRAFSKRDDRRSRLYMKIQASVQLQRKPLLSSGLPSSTSKCSRRKSEYTTSTRKLQYPT